jgi:hypothetical protein
VHKFHLIYPCANVTLQIHWQLGLLQHKETVTRAAADAAGRRVDTDLLASLDVNADLLAAVKNMAERDAANRRRAAVAETRAAAAAAAKNSHRPGDGGSGVGDGGNGGGGSQPNAALDKYASAVGSAAVITDTVTATATDTDGSGFGSTAASAEVVIGPRDKFKLAVQATVSAYRELKALKRAEKEKEKGREQGEAGTGKGKGKGVNGKDIRGGVGGGGASSSSSSMLANMRRQLGEGYHVEQHRPLSRKYLFANVLTFVLSCSLSCDVRCKLVYSDM